MRLDGGCLLELEPGSTGDNETWRGVMLSIVMSFCFLRRRLLFADVSFGVSMLILLEVLE